MTRQEATARSRRRSAAIAAAGIVLITVLVFVGRVSTGSEREVRATFSSANGLKVGSEVRVAGVRVGSVDEIEAGPRDDTVVTMRIDPGRSVRADARLAIRPRLLLEGNFYVDLSPGTPAAPELADGGRIAKDQTSVPVQADQLINVFDLPTRRALHSSIKEIGEGFGTGSSEGSRGRVTGAEGARGTFHALSESLDSFGRVAHAARGSRPGELGRAVRSSGNFTSALATDPVALGALVTHVENVSAAFADEGDGLMLTIREANALLGAAPPALRELDDALPSTTRFGTALEPALKAIPAPIRETNKLAAEVEHFLNRDELPAVIDSLPPVTGTLPELERRLRGLLGPVITANRCLSTRIVPTLSEDLQDGPNSTGDPAWLDLLHATTGGTGISSSFDANGVVLRAGVTEGELALTTITSLAKGPVVAGGPEIQGVRPTWLGYGVEPPYRPDAPCTEQDRVALSARSGGPPEWLNRTTRAGRRR